MLFFVQLHVHMYKSCDCKLNRYISVYPLFKLLKCTLLSNPSECSCLCEIDKTILATIVWEGLKQFINTNVTNCITTSIAAAVWFIVQYRYSLAAISKELESVNLYFQEEKITVPPEPKVTAKMIHHQSKRNIEILVVDL